MSGIWRRRHFHRDRLGNVIASVRQDGELADQYLYSPFGLEHRPVDPSGNPLRYTGQRYDGETGFYYYKARYYDPSLRRFLKTDPLLFADQMNLYAYVGNDPVNHYDPSGMCTGSRLKNKDGTCPGGGLTTGISGLLAERVSRATAGAPTIGPSNQAEGFPDPTGAQEREAAVYAQMGRATAVSGAAIAGELADQLLNDAPASALQGNPGEAAVLAAMAVLPGPGKGKVARVADQIADFIGPGAKAVRTGRGNLTITSADGLRRFRIDFSQKSAGRFQGPHAQFEARSARNRKFKPVEDVPPHIYFKE